MIFTCQHCKNTPNSGKYPRRYQWKTQKGFDNHNCVKDIIARNEAIVASVAKRKAELKAAYKLRRAAFIEASPYHIGDTVHYVSYRVTGPTHEQRGGRLVQVRYEELRRYYANSGKIQDIDAGWYTINGQLIPTHDIYTTAQAAESAANAAQISYGTAVKFAQYCR